MIAYIQGTIISKSPNYVVVSVNSGIGYGIEIPLSTFYGLPEAGDKVTLHVHTHVQKDSLRLYGFATVDEKHMFLTLLNVSGIGPKLATNILSGISPLDLKDSILIGDVERIDAIPGVGKKMAERILFELREKVPQGISLTEQDSLKRLDSEEILRDALCALTNLGYEKKVARRALSKIWEENSGNMTIEELLKRTLQSFSKDRQSI